MENKQTYHQSQETFDDFFDNSCAQKFSKQQQNQQKFHQNDQNNQQQIFSQQFQEQQEIIYPQPPSNQYQDLMNNEYFEEEKKDELQPQNQLYNSGQQNFIQNSQTNEIFQYEQELSNPTFTENVQNGVIKTTKSIQKNVSKFTGQIVKQVKSSLQLDQDPYYQIQDSQTLGFSEQDQSQQSQSCPDLDRMSTQQRVSNIISDNISHIKNSINRTKNGIIETFAGLGQGLKTKIANYVRSTYEQNRDNLLEYVQQTAISFARSYGDKVIIILIILFVLLIISQIEGEENRTSEDVISDIQEYQITDTNRQNDTCSICMQGFDKGEYVKKLNCNHEYHKDCISHWLRVKNTCPMCRNVVQ